MKITLFLKIILLISLNVDFNLKNMEIFLLNIKKNKMKQFIYNCNLIYF